MSTLAEIEAAVEMLPKPEQEKLFQHLAMRLHAGEMTMGKLETISRSSGLHAAAWEVSVDFDAPLPNEFWTGHEV